MPNDHAMLKWLFIKMLLTCMSSALMFLITQTMLELSFGFWLSDSRFWAALALFFLNVTIFRFANRFSLRNSAEISLGTVIFAVVPSTPLAVFVPHVAIVMYLVALLTVLHPYSAGPEPDGWWPTLRAINEARERAKLKGRREK